MGKLAQSSHELARQAIFPADKVNVATIPKPMEMPEPRPTATEPPGAAAADNPLSAEHRAALATAKQRRRRIDRAAGVAGFNAWSTAIFATLSWPFAPFSGVALVMAAGLTGIAYGEFKGRAMLRRFNPHAPRWLGCNQLAFLALIIGYCLWSIYVGLTGPNPYAEQIATTPELADILGPIDEWYKPLILGMYGLIIVLSLIFQGGTAYYYFSRKRHLQAYLDQTPAWVIQCQQAGT